jgi:phage gp29-like protein
MTRAKRTEAKATPSTIIQKIIITQNKRGSQDIENWRNAIQSAESVTMPRRILLYDLYEEILVDGHLTAVIEKRKLSVTNTPVVFVENGKEHDEITELTKTEDFINLLHYIIESKLWGHSLIELNFDGLKLQPRLIPRKHVEPKKGIILKNQFDQTGFSYRDYPYADFVIEVGEENSLGLLMKAAQYAIYKRCGFGDWSQYAELFGMPFRIAKYDGFDEKTRGELESSLREAGSAAFVVIPKEADFEFVQNNAQASNTLYESLISLCNKEMSKLILGQTMTTEAGGALAQAKVHQEAERDLLMADKLFVRNVLNDRLIPLLQKHGYNVGKGKFFFKEQEHVDMKTRLEMDLKLAEKIQIDDKYFYETYNVPAPKPPKGALTADNQTKL